MAKHNIAREAFAAERRRKAIELRLQGYRWHEIAERLDYASKAAAYVDVKRALEKANTELSIPREALRELEVQRLDTELVRLYDLQQAVMPQALGGDLRAVDTALRIEEARRKNIKQRADLLGLEAPKQVELTMEAIDVALAETAAELAAARSEVAEAEGTEGSES